MTGIGSWANNLKSSSFAFWEKEKSINWTKAQRSRRWKSWWIFANRETGTRLFSSRMANWQIWINLNRSIAVLRVNCNGVNSCRSAEQRTGNNIIMIMSFGVIRDDAQCGYSIKNLLKYFLMHKCMLVQWLLHSLINQYCRSLLVIVISVTVTSFPLIFELFPHRVHRFWEL